jgi:hypothetical protein
VKYFEVECTRPEIYVINQELSFKNEIVTHIMDKQPLEHNTVHHDEKQSVEI